jgi:ribosomal protein L40E
MFFTSALMGALSEIQLAQYKQQQAQKLKDAELLHEHYQRQFEAAAKLSKMIKPKPHEAVSCSQCGAKQSKVSKMFNKKVCSYCNSDL